MTATLTVTVPGQGTWSSPFDRDLVAGRELGSDLLLAHSSVSDPHARFSAVDGRASVKDLNSAQHTMVNGHRIGPFEEGILQDGDVVQLGDVFIAVAIPRESSQPTTATTASTPPKIAGPSLNPPPAVKAPLRTVRVARYVVIGVAPLPVLKLIRSRIRRPQGR